MDTDKTSVSAIGAVYDKAARAYKDTFGLKLAEHLDDFLALVVPHGVIADVGCGTGVNAHYLALHGFQVRGCDLSEEMIKLARDRFPGIEFHVADMRHLAYHPNSLDGIVASYSLIHIPKNEMGGVLHEFYEKLKKGGIVYVSLQEGISAEISLPAPFAPEEKVFLNIISHLEAQALMTQSGFTLVQQFHRPPKLGEHPFVKRVLLAKK